MSGWPYPGTRKDWFHNRYNGVLRDAMGDEFWTCEHMHKTSREALDCAWTYRNSKTWESL